MGSTSAFNKLSGFPCKDCPDRHELCRKNCEKYAAARAEHEKKKAYLNSFRHPWTEGGRQTEMRAIERRKKFHNY